MTHLNLSRGFPIVRMLYLIIMVIGTIYARPYYDGFHMGLYMAPFDLATVKAHENLSGADTEMFNIPSPRLGIELSQHILGGIYLSAQVEQETRQGEISGGTVQDTTTYYGIGVGFITSVIGYWVDIRTQRRLSTAYDDAVKYGVLFGLAHTSFDLSGVSGAIASTYGGERTGYYWGMKITLPYFSLLHRDLAVDIDMKMVTYPDENGQKSPYESKFIFSTGLYWYPFNQIN